MDDMLENLFKNAKVDFKKLVKYGFVKENDHYSFSTDIIDNQFTLKIWLDKNGKISTKIFDKSTEDEYILHLLPDISGAFVGRVKKEYEDTLVDIREKCFEKHIFKNQQTQDVIKYIKDKYDDEFEFLWEKSPNNAISRRKDNKKWYIALLTIPGNKLNIDTESDIEIVDIRADENVSTLVDNKTIFPGYHMNKKHWITIVLDYSIPNEKLFNLIDESYILANKSK